MGAYWDSAGRYHVWHDLGYRWSMMLTRVDCSVVRKAVDRYLAPFGHTLSDTTFHDSGDIDWHSVSFEVTRAAS